MTVVDPGEGSGGARLPPLILGKKKKKSQKEEKLAKQAKQNCPLPLSSRPGSATVRFFKSQSEKKTTVSQIWFA